MCARIYNIRELGNEQGLVWQEVYWKIGTLFLFRYTIYSEKEIPHNMYSIHDMGITR